MPRIGKCPNCKASIPREWAGWAGWGLAVLLLIVLVWRGLAPPKTAGQPEDEQPPAAVRTPQTAAPNRQPASVPSLVAKQPAFPLGSLAVLLADDEVVIPAGGTAEAFQRMRQLATARDRQGVRELILTGHVLTVADGTQCRVVAMGGTRCEVELLNGTYAGRRCFVMPRYVAKE